MTEEAISPLMLWAKGAPRDEASPYHPLICHLIDVAVVARAMWETVVPPAARRWFAAGLGLDEAAVGRWVALWAGLHDIGKAAPAFQWQRRDPRFRALNTQAPHGTISARVLPDLLSGEPFALAPLLADRIATVVGGHHGVLPRSEQLNDVPRDALGGRVWVNAREALVGGVAEVVGLLERPASDLDNARLMWLAGLISVADWIGSDETFFPWAVGEVRSSPLAPSAYAAEAAKRARRALAELGWSAWPAATEPRAFAELFPTITTPRPVQEAVIRLAQALSGPSLTIVEAPMGEGKTEAALYLADRGNAVDGLRGHYVALPTRATSDQMFGRVREFLRQRYPGEVVNLQLLHGHAALSAELEMRERLPDPRGIAGDAGWDRAPADVLAAEWFTHRKRGVLAPFGVGTVDQGLLAVLQTRHVFVRLFGLAHKTVVIDEVHAYDAYMSTLLERLLAWLGALGCAVVLLSATLPRGRRERLAEAYESGLKRLPNPLARHPEGTRPPAVGGKREDAAPYPRVTWVGSTGRGAIGVGVSAQSRKEIGVRWLTGGEGDDEALGRLLAIALAGGGCAAVICNTVRRAQEVYRALRPFFGGVASDGGPELELLHARFLFKDREERERRALARFGKGETGRPERSVLVATQVIEQSLDLDFDLMVTELAPADLMLQRAGRLHRHERTRPAGLERPTLWIRGPREEEGAPVFDRATTYVYDEHVLLRSWWELRGRAVIRVPDEVEGLIEAVYDDERGCPADAGEAFRAKWDGSLRRLVADRQEEVGEAQKRWLKSPDYRGLIWRLTADPREEDAPDFHREHQALTRLSEPAVDVVCLFGGSDHARTDPLAGELVSLKGTPSQEEARHLLRNSVRVTGPGIVQQLLLMEAPAGWKRSALMRHCRLLLFDDQGIAMVGAYRVHLDPFVGLEAL